MKRAVLYLRSSKDRSDVSIDAQRHGLQKLAAERNLLIVNEYTDVVESAKSEYRPAFQQLVADLKRPGRAWSVILMIDHSRLSRQPYVGHVFRYEAAKSGVEVVFGMMPELDPVSKIILDSVMDAMAVVHSIMSKQKGLAGMAENVRRGWRAGGRAPRGYRLSTVTTGAVRDGKPVEKSVLEPSDEAPLVARYLKARALGTPRAKVIRELGIDWTSSSLIAMEWNALTYAGHTVWNRHNETIAGTGGYKDKHKMRPRSEWHVTRDTHAGLISEAEAEAILTQLENSTLGEAVSRAKRGISKHMLTGFLAAPDGRLYEGWRDNYRLKANGERNGRYVKKESIERAIVAQITADFQSDAFIDALLKAARDAADGAPEDPAKELRHEVVALNGQISKASDLALQLEDPAPMLRKIQELEARRRGLAEEINRIEREHALQSALRGVTREQIAERVQELAEEVADADQSRLKGILQAAIERIVLDPQSLECRVHYRIPLERTLSMASPRGFEPMLPP